MKNLAKLALVTTMAAMLLAGCGSSSAPADTAADASTDTAQVEEAVEEVVEEEAAAEEAMTFEEYVNSDADIKAQLDQVADQMGMKISADGNSLVYEYALDMEVDDSQKEALTEQFDAAMADQADTFNSMKSQLEDETGISGVSIVINYVDSNGNLVYTTTF